MDNKHSKSQAVDQISQEIAACMQRADLQPPVIPEGGFPLDRHYSATLAAGDLPKLELNLPLQRPTKNGTKKPVTLEK